MKTHLLIAFSLLVFAGCANIDSIEEQNSGFLGDYSNMKVVKMKDKSKARRWINPDIKKGQYTKVIVPQITFFPAPRTSDQVQLETLNKIADYLTKQIRAEVSKNFELTDKAGPDTVQIQVAITGVATPMEGLSAYEVTPMTLAFAGASAAAGARDRLAVVYVEAIATDSLTGAELAKGLRQGVGESLRDDKEQLDVSKVQAILDGWASVLGEMANETLN
ncbi:DUF3313 domain-containing protein [Ketobacter alkanivorans]|uniref:DUF3313 domain-containing protein n=1 Tax=Ketobacter alkanivorans TaxID=1917421 RepID=A0A2K9LID7_9GAMM|nr:DUF3313 domain-containing protein [Ketobacter alkanivorans]AUM12119.1 hypothetical protein Kalk_06710 [Ketobacter alkanivorans]